MKKLLYINKMSKLIFFFLFLFTLTTSETYEGVKVFEISKSNNGKKNEVSITVKEGEEFALKFRGNPTTGYTWVLLNTDQLKDSLKDLRQKLVSSYAVAYVDNYYDSLENENAKRM